ncbi:MAG TPA: DsrE family protein [Verrucomicrobiae bacterium]
MRGKKLGLLLSTAPGQPGFEHGVRLAGAALDEGADVYLYCIDEAARGAEEPRLLALAARGLKLYICAYSVQRRGLQRGSEGIYAGLGSLSDLVSATDRFVSFN